ncbi:hypothetical protein OIE66_39470 [Nonomuraea sp. NBC_01738]|uniref:hypothetical protein n=1 Tax=Nonomuraea sp. NBC_01738 TaxID=2976003 RepID=UPI002E14CBA1|nr:hypothetical protein OIE66_39470 [Nonomuraea sp. NBC_01738]
MRTSVGITVLALAAGLFAAQPASAATTAACTLQPGIPLKSGSKIEGAAGVTGTCGLTTMKLQRKRWYGWQTMADKSWDGTSGSRRVITTACSGSYEWRVWMYAEKAGGATNNTRKITC